MWFEKEDKLIIKSDMYDILGTILLEVFIWGFGFFCYLEIKLPLRELLIIYVVIEVVCTYERFQKYSEYVLDSNGITRKFWKYEKFYFWGEFSTKHIASLAGTGHTVLAIFALEKADKEEWGEHSPYLKLMLSKGFFNFSLEVPTPKKWQVESWKWLESHEKLKVLLKKMEALKLADVDGQLLIQKLEEWNVDFVYCPSNVGKWFKD